MASVLNLRLTKTIAVVKTNRIDAWLDLIGGGSLLPTHQLIQELRTQAMRLGWPVNF